MSRCVVAASIGTAKDDAARRALATLTNGPSRAAIILMVLGVLWAGIAQAAFDQRHESWDALLKKSVVTAPSGVSSAVRYASLKAGHDALREYLASLSAVSPQEYSRWSRADQLAFLINAYNAYTIELVLSRYPELKSIKDLGSLLQSPWKKRFFRLLGSERSLDDLEHGLIRAPGAFDEPRIHFVLVCASVGCPMLRDEALVGTHLDTQLDDSMRRFLSDRTRNRFDGASDTLAVSKIFDWYYADFEPGKNREDALKVFFARHADVLGSSANEQVKIRSGRYKIVYLDYDWSLNDSQ